MKSGRACAGVVVVMSLLCAGGCADKSPAEVSSGEMASVRKSHTSLKPGTPRDQALASFPKGNKVKLGAASIGDMSIEEWKVEAFADQKKRKDLFVTFLYFLDGKLADSSDTRIDFRNNPDLVEGWKGNAAAKE
jgi:hypothetical protein